MSNNLKLTAAAVKGDLAEVRKLRAEIADTEKRHGSLKVEVEAALREADANDQAQIAAITMKETQIKILPNQIGRLKSALDTVARKMPDALRQLQNALLEQANAEYQTMLAQAAAALPKKFFPDEKSARRAAACSPVLPSLSLEKEMPGDASMRSQYPDDFDSRMIEAVEFFLGVFERWLANDESFARSSSGAQS